ncbi:MAG: putative motility protein [Calditerrivibrio sp.]|nr:putative motility protein [Calditerrivibrio sp.]MCA1932898.1 putative motility protein [Calditerrivibrio sp.]MCA1979955.1 putative motility protein [Calditerrivibrio sp.]
MNIESLSSYKMAQSQYAYGVKVAKKALDLQKQQGSDVMKLIQSAKMIQQPKNNIDLYA